MAIVTLDEQKAHLGVTLDNDDALITQQIDAAQAHLESLFGYVIETEFPDGAPADIVGAVKMLAAHYYENREASVVGVSVNELPLGVWSVVTERRAYSFGYIDGEE
ncbi:head-tail connector protein [Mesorhizobium sp. CN2-181]|uniref:head-tail connector protein n=1 Tax=Mesorhizobium yinganensis TaxID=3157707 RepID=UPI0032B8633C